MIRHFVGYAGGIALLLVGMVLVQGGAPAFGPQEQEKPGKTGQQDDPTKQKKAPPKEEEERTPKGNLKAPPHVDDEDEEPARVSGRDADLTQEARKAKNPVVRELFQTLSPPHDLLTYTSTGRTLKIETVPFFMPVGGDLPPHTRVKSLEAKRNSVTNVIELQKALTRSVQGFEQVVLARVNEFLKLDLDKKPADDREHLSRLEMLQEAEKAILAGIVYHRSESQKGNREERVWGSAGRDLERRLVDIQVQRLRILTEAKDWSKAYEVALVLADSYTSKESTSQNKSGIQVEILNLLAMQANDAAKDKRFSGPRHRLLQLQEQFPKSAELEPFREELRRHGTELLEQARELFNKKDPEKARAKLISVQEIDPKLAGLRDLTLELNKEHPVLVVGVRSLPTNLSPALAVTDSERQGLELIFESLVRLVVRQPSVDKYERYEPGLTSDMPKTAPLSRCFQLSHDALWDNGEPVRAAEVKKTIQLMSSPGWASRDIEWSKLMANSPQIEDDAFQIKLTMPHGYMDPLALMDFKVLPESLQSMTFEAFARQPKGSGPFHFKGRLVGEDKVERAVFTANQYYGARANRDGLPKIREIHMVKSEDPAHDFREEKLGLLLDPPSAKFKELQSAGIDGVVTFHTLRNRRIYFLALNHRNSVFQNEAFRRGLANAIQREAILNQCFRKDLGNSTHRALNGPYPPGSWAFKPDLKAYDTISAKALLEQAKGARAAKITLTLKYPDEDPAVAEACQLIKTQIEDADPSLTIEPMPRTPQQLHREVEIDHDYQLAYYSHDYPSAAFWLWPLFQLDGVHDNFLGYKNDGDLEGLLRKLMGHRDFTQFQKLAYQVHQHIFDKVPFVPLWQLDTHLVVRRNLQIPGGPVGVDPLAVFQDAESWVLGKD
jgi:peptide/nickel transport system substrate-binding protein